MQSRTLGSTFIIAGTSIGAGMIAMPLVTAMVGFRAAVILMVVNWLLAAGSGLLVAQVCCARTNVTTLFSAASEQLGRPGRVAATLATICLPYALCAAYIAGAAGFLAGSLEHWFGLVLPFGGDVIAVTLVFAAVIQAGTRYVDWVNRSLFLLQLAMLAVLLVALLPAVDWARLDSPMTSPNYLVAALPLFFTSFGFQATVPSIVRYLEGDPKRFRPAILWGASLPMLVYLLWTAASNGVVSHDALVHMSREQEPVSALVISLTEASHSAGVTTAITLFTALALTTSFLGVALGLFDYMAEAMGHTDSVRGRYRTAAITFLPPLIAVLLVPGAFIAALGFAAVALVVLALLLPGLMVRKLYGDSLESWQRMLLSLVMMLGGVIILAQVLVAVGVMPQLG